MPAQVAFENIEFKVICSDSPEILEEAVQHVYAISEAQCLLFQNLDDKDYVKSFHTQNKSLHSLKIKSLGLNHLSNSTIELIIGMLLDKPKIELIHICLGELTDSSLHVIYDYCIISQLKQQVVEVKCASTVPAEFREKFSALRDRNTFLGIAIKQFNYLMKTRLKDRHNYAIIAEKMEQSFNQTLSQKDAKIEESRVVNQNQAIQIELLSAELKKSQETAAESKSVAATDSQIETALRAENEKYKKMMADVRLPYTALFSAHAITDNSEPSVFPVIDKLKYEKEQKRVRFSDATNDDMVVEIDSSKTTDRDSDSDKEEEKMVENSQDDDTVCSLLQLADSPPSQPSLQEDLKKRILDTLSKRILKKPPAQLQTFLQEQISVADTLINQERRFHEIEGSKTDAIFHYIAFMLCNARTTPSPYTDHKHQREILLETLSNMLCLIEELNKQYVNVKIRLDERNSELIIKHLTEEIARLTQALANDSNRTQLAVLQATNTALQTQNTDLTNQLQNKGSLDATLLKQTRETAVSLQKNLNQLLKDKDQDNTQIAKYLKILQEAVFVFHNVLAENVISAELQARISLLLQTVSSAPTPANSSTFSPRTYPSHTPHLFAHTQPITALSLLQSCAPFNLKKS
jgi:hypothetical protein